MAVADLKLDLHVRRLDLGIRLVVWLVTHRLAALARLVPIARVRIGRRTSWVWWKRPGWEHVPNIP